MIKIASLSNNYGKSYDGVGDFARAQNESFPDWIECDIYTADCTYETSKIGRFLGLGMFKEILRLSKVFGAKGYDIVMMDYPFVEWNPFILLPLLGLKRKITKYNKRFVLSLHEYNRVNPLRKMIIRYICRMADMVLVGDEEIKKSISAFSREIAIRPIPTNLYNKAVMEEDIAKRSECFVYFGLVNHAKAFYELLDAWSLYNEKNAKTLYILTASPLEGLEEKYPGVRYLYNKNADEILRIMKCCAFCMIPVIPEVDMKNATFKTGSLAGCVCVGRFGEEYMQLPFVVQMENYTVEEFQKTFESLDNISDSQIEDMYRAAVEFGEQYTPQATAGIVADILKSMIEREAEC